MLARLFHDNGIYAALRDNHRLYYDRVWWALRRYYLEVGRRLAASGLLAAADDVFFLSRDELGELRAGDLQPDAAAERVTFRRKQWQETNSWQPPKFLVDGYAPAEQLTLAELDAETMVGLSASPGSATGRARVLHDVADLEQVRPGEILVARQTDPGWTPVFSRLGALVLETGGVLAHGASLCREYGLPCVTVVERASTRIRTGDLVAVSGTNGTVSIL